MARFDDIAQVSELVQLEFIVILLLLRLLPIWLRCPLHLNSSFVLGDPDHALLYLLLFEFLNLLFVLVALELLLLCVFFFQFFLKCLDDLSAETWDLLKTFVIETLNITQIVLFIRLLAVEELIAQRYQPISLLLQFLNQIVKTLIFEKARLTLRRSSGDLLATS